MNSTDIKVIILSSISIAILIIILILILKPKSDNYKYQKAPIRTKLYKVKNSLMTKCETEFYYAIKKILPPNYILQPQINLASIIEKTNSKYYINELFRNIDFCIFDEKYLPMILIEINDQTHETNKKRQARDIKVKKICQEAGIPLVTLWTKYGVNEDYIKYRIYKILKP